MTLQISWYFYTPSHMIILTLMHMILYMKSKNLLHLQENQNINKRMKFSCDCKLINNFINFYFHFLRLHVLVSTSRPITLLKGRFIKQHTWTFRRRNVVTSNEILLERTSLLCVPICALRASYNYGLSYHPLEGTTIALKFRSLNPPSQ